MAAAETAVVADDDEEADEDYVPMEEGDDEAGNVLGESIEEQAGLPSCTLSLAKRKAVDDAFQALFGYPFGTRFKPKRQKVLSDDHNRQHRLLVQVFGSNTAAQLLATSNSVRAHTIPRAPPPDLSAPTMVQEVKRFAGKNIVVQRKVAPSKAAAKSGTRKKDPPKGLDSLLKEISGPSKLSTVAKTSADWDSFKVDTGIDDQLEQQAQSKDAFLVKKDFLNRVDHRQFEHERSKRDTERSKRGK